MEVSHWLDVRSVIIGAVLVIAVIDLFENVSSNNLQDAGFVLINAAFCGILVSMIIRFFLSVYGDYWGVVPTLLLSFWVVLSELTMEEKIGPWAAEIILLGASVSTLLTSWGHLLMFGIFACIDTPIIVCIVRDILNRRKNLKR